MKIALVILHADPARGGAERYTVDLAVALQRRGHHVALISSDTLNVRGATRAGQYRRFLHALDEHLAHSAYDIVHAMLPVRRCDVYHPHAGMAAEAMGKWNRFLNPRRVAMARVERRLLTGPHAPVVIALSEFVKRAIRRFYAIGDDRLPTLFNAVDLQRFDPQLHSHLRSESRGRWGAGDADIVALMVAQDFERKGVSQAMEAVALMKTDPVSPLLVVIGKQDPTPYARRSYDLGIEERTTFAGPTPENVRAYNAADFFVLPTKHDPCSLVVLESLAMGLPVISTKFNGATEIMTDGVHGYVLDDPNNVDALAVAMKKMMDPSRREQMSKACLELRPTLSYEHHLDHLIEIYQQVHSARRFAQTSTARSTE